MGYLTDIIGKPQKDFTKEDWQKYTKIRNEKTKESRKKWREKRKIKTERTKIKQCSRSNCRGSGKMLEGMGDICPKCKQNTYG